jgi:hypothetical protein
MNCEKPDRVPVWCLLSLEHIVNHGTKDGEIPETIEELVQAECRLVKEYKFDGTLVYFPGLRKDVRVFDLIKKAIQSIPEGDSANNFENADPETWIAKVPNYSKEDFYSSHLTRELLGTDLHIGGWIPDGFSRAIQWFPNFDEAMMASLLDPLKFKTMVDYFDQESIASAKAQVELGKLESLQISSPYAGSSLISLNSYKDLVLNSVKVLARAIRSVNGKSYLHTCGFIADRIDVFVSTEVDGIECMDPPPLGDMLLSDAKERVGDKIFLKGNIDSVNILLRGEDAQVDQVIRDTIQTGMRGGGYILSTACSVAPKVPPGRVRRLWELAEEYGKY